MTKRLLCFILAFLFLSCSERQRLNPLDPLNPETGGRPTGLRVISEYKTVTLWWDRINVKDLQGYNVYRKQGRDQIFHKIAMVSPDSSRFRDKGVNYGITYFYQLSAFTPSFESPRSEVVSITPGPTFNWVVDTQRGQVVKLTFDGLHQIFRIGGFGLPVAITPDRKGGGVWVADYFYGKVYKISPNGRILSSFTGFSTPRELDVDTLRKNIWVADTRKVVKMDSTGIVLVQVTGYSKPVSVSVDDKTGDCWVADCKNGVVTRISEKGEPVLVLHDLMRPSSVGVCPLDGSCWVADSSRVLRLNPDMSIRFVVPGFTYARGLSVDTETGECWVIDVKEGPGQSRVVKLSPTGIKLLEVTGFSAPKGISANPYDGSCTVADTYNNRIVRVSAEGKIISQLGGFLQPWGVAVGE